jgi:hypothetical protein
VKAALHTLATRSIIATRTGGGAKTSTHLLTYLQTRQMGGITASPPPQLPGIETALEWDRSEPTPTPQVGSEQAQGGIGMSPPPTENKGLPDAASALDISTDSIKTLDRVLTASAKGKDRAELQHWAEIVRTYSERLRRTYNQDPDVHTIARLMEACGNQRETLYALIQQIALDKRQPGWTPEWWVVIALQRIHRIDAKTTAARRAELREAGKAKLQRVAKGQLPASSDDELKRAIANAAEGMSPEWMKRK